MTDRPRLQPRRPRPTRSSRATGIVKRWGIHRRRSSGATFAVGRGRHRPARRERRRQDHPARHDARPAPPRRGSPRVLGPRPGPTAGPAVRARVGYSPEHHTLPPDAQRPRPRAPHRRDPRPAPPRGHRPGQRRALAGRARRGALPPDRHDVDRPAPAGEAGPGHRPRPRARPARRADRRPRPGAARRHAGAHPPHRHRVRHRRAAVVAPARGGRAGLRRRGDPRRRRWSPPPARSPSCAAPARACVLELDADPAQHARVVDVLRAAGAEVRDDGSRLARRPGATTCSTSCATRWSTQEPASAACSRARCRSRTCSSASTCQPTPMTAEPCPHELGSPADDRVGPAGQPVTGLVTGRRPDPRPRLPPLRGRTPRRRRIRPQPGRPHDPAGPRAAPHGLGQGPAGPRGGHRLRPGHRVRRHRRRSVRHTSASPTTDLPTYGEYYGFIVSAIIVFVAFVAPEVLCTDRRTGMLGLYLASPLTRDTYLLAKAIAVAVVLATVVPRAAAAHARRVRAAEPRARRLRRPAAHARPDPGRRRVHHRVLHRRCRSPSPASPTARPSRPRP